MDWVKVRALQACSLFNFSFLSNSYSEPAKQVRKEPKIKKEIDFDEIEKILNEHKDFLNKSCLNDKSYLDDGMLSVSSIKSEDQSMKRKSLDFMDEEFFGDLPSLKLMKTTKPELSTLPSGNSSEYFCLVWVPLVRKRQSEYLNYLSFTT